MCSTLAASQIQIDRAPIQTPTTTGMVEQYHAPLHADDKRIHLDLGLTTTKEDCLTLVVHAVKSSIGAEVLCPILLVFGTVPRPARTKPSPM